MSEHLRNLVERFKHDRKLAIMAGLLVVALLLWGRLLLQSPLPQTATATANVAARAQPATPLPALEVGPQARAVVQVDLPDYLTRDLFNFPAEEHAWAVPKNVEPEANEEKSEPQRSDDQLRSATVRKAAEDLQLRSVMMGESPSAVINGRVLRPGQQIQGFTLLEVSERHVLLERHGVIVRLKM
ncbi:MAG: hypothetical protein WD534_09760 [Phycisphaeraceae bacterium]